MNPALLKKEYWLQQANTKAYTVASVVAMNVLNGKPVSEILSEFEQGQIPELLTLSIQMALLAISVDLSRTSLQSKTEIRQELIQPGSMQSIGIKHFIKAVKNSSMNLSHIKKVIRKCVFDEDKKDRTKQILLEHLSPVNTERNSEFKDLSAIKSCLHEIHLNQSELVASFEPIQSLEENFNEEYNELYCNMGVVHKY